MIKHKKGVGMGGSAFLLLTAATAVSLSATPVRASVIVDNLSDTFYTAEYAGAGDAYLAQDFTTGSSSANLTALTLSLKLTGTQTVDVYLYDVNSTSYIPTAGSGILIGTYTGGTSGDDVITMIATPALSANTMYAIAIADPSK
jgi:hypothetical protein